MTGKIKATALVILSILALGALGPASALAEDEITAEEYPAFLEGSLMTHLTFKIEGREATCKVEHYKATLNAKTGIDTFESEYTGCTAKVGMIEVPLTIDMNGCDWDYVIKDKWYNLVCPSGKKAILTAYSSVEQHMKKTPSCEYTVPAQEELGYVEYENMSGLPGDIRLSVNLTGVEYTVSGFPFVCGENGTFNNGTLTSETTVSAKNEAGEPIGVMIG